MQAMGRLDMCVSLQCQSADQQADLRIIPEAAHIIPSLATSAAGWRVYPAGGSPGGYGLQVLHH